MGGIFELGDITCPSGELVIVDAGHLGLWSGVRSPADIDPGSFGIDDPSVAADVLHAVDLEITGPDAEAAARSFDRQPGRALYDIPVSRVADMRALFGEHCRSLGLRAGLEACAERVSHRERVRRVVGEGGGAFLMHGLPVVAVGGLPRDRELPVLRSGEGTVIPVSGTPAAKSMHLGEIRVDWARVLFGDAEALGSWQHDEPVDGLTDVAFWGAAQKEAATAFGAPALGEPGEDGIMGWTGLAVGDAVRKARALMAWQDADPRRRMRVDLRPHSHHWQVMREVRASAVEAGCVEVGGARMLCAMTGRGDGWFPVSVDLDRDGGPVAVRLGP
ncbi:hypothetical protein [Streptomyces chiangmaiensis]|uniref:Uncharacterized protein n=1 Tax=Streptomyces chiangmaiensis TaxID=766497 RepID=A0ABU7FI05_9ACTN|nr:hypothetical protein [Streptomyces chiangmaiensis]MED7822789.1 hypothetical protein [Streptomyces chiangmaiensis]